MQKYGIFEKKTIPQVYPQNLDILLRIVHFLSMILHHPAHCYNMTGNNNIIFKTNTIIIASIMIVLFVNLPKSSINKILHPRPFQCFGKMFVIETIGN